MPGPPPAGAAAALGAKLLDRSLPLPLRFRVLFSLRGLATPDAVAALLAGLADPSALFRHEVAFALGQMQAQAAVGALALLLEDVGEHSMVRHEAAEALGAIGLPGCLALLERHAADPCREVAETCQLALRRIQYWETSRAAPAAEPERAAGGSLGSRKETFSHQPSGEAQPAQADDSPYLSIDRVPPAPAATPLQTLRETLLDEGAPIFERYRALFALRNRGGAPVAQLCVEVLHASGSALLKHEVCYVLGQLQEPSAGPALHALLADDSQHAMVRHEAAEALGSIAGAESRQLLQRYLADGEAIVAEGALVALDILDYEESGSFEYCAMPE